MKIFLMCVAMMAMCGCDKLENQSSSAPNCMNVEGEYDMLATKIEDTCTPNTGITTSAMSVTFEVVARNAKTPTVCVSLLEFRNSDMYFDGMLMATIRYGELPARFFINDFPVDNGEVISVDYVGYFYPPGEDPKNAYMHHGRLTEVIPGINCDLGYGTRTFVISGKKHVESE